MMKAEDSKDEEKTVFSGLSVPSFAFIVYQGGC